MPRRWRSFFNPRVPRVSSSPEFLSRGRRFNIRSMASRRIWESWLFAIAVIAMAALCRSDSFLASDRTQLSTVNVVSDIADSIVEKLGWKPEEVKISNVNSLETLFGHAVLYEFDIQIGDVVVPLKLSEDVKSWQLMEFPGSGVNGSETGEVEKTLARSQVRPEAAKAVLAPFQVAGPLELWIQDADHMRLSLPHDVEAGVLKKVLLADGAVVTVKGAREVSLRQPLQLPLPLGSGTGKSSLASNLLALAARLRHASRAEEKPLLSLRIVGPSSLAASSNSEPVSGTSNKLRVKRLAPGSVELVSRQQQENLTPVSLEAAASTVGLNDMWMWPLPSVNGSDSKLQGFEKLLLAVLGPNARKEGSFKLLRAQGTAATFIKTQFEIEKGLGNDVFDSDLWPEWRTRPSVTRLQFELTAKVEGDNILPVNVRQVGPVVGEDSFSWNVLRGNVSMSKIPVLYPPSSSFTL